MREIFLEFAVSSDSSQQFLMQLFPFIGDTYSESLLTKNGRRSKVNHCSRGLLNWLAGSWAAMG